jgi:hypothetical protein
VDTSLVIGAPYAPPTVMWRGEAAQRQRIVWWVVFVGFAYLLALAYATYCRHTGGDPDIELTWKGFKVTCKSS